MISQLLLPCCCSCSDTDVNCAGKGFTSVPSGIPASTTLLHLEINRHFYIHVFVDVSKYESKECRITENNVKKLRFLQKDTFGIPKGACSVTLSL